MPQMSPLQWDLLFLFCLSGLILMMMKFYFLSSLLTNFTKKNYFLLNSLNWSW